ncbi:hypothetical protein E2493_06310 [Sphingomonas parva]|uniref:Uncharacterized protein n=1 Tax=Sphingomonas parva TaxID=2555898 RepID=A0A4Y8ZVI1_9SPHN|nr:hypothetical protein [Sphingomonas parva]TFI59135.1 hypothetical protein E2493_06310 [Sphingomonas parva]
MDDGHFSGRVDRLERDVGELRADFASVKATLASFGGVLGEIKATLSSARPAWYVVVPMLLAAVLAIASAVLAFGSLRADQVRADALAAVRERQLEALAGRLDRIEQRQWAAAPEREPGR